MNLVKIKADNLEIGQICSFGDSGLGEVLAIENFKNVGTKLYFIFVKEKNETFSDIGWTLGDKRLVISNFDVKLFDVGSSVAFKKIGQGIVVHINRHHRFTKGVYYLQMDIYSDVIFDVVVNDKNSISLKAESILHCIENAKIIDIIRSGECTISLIGRNDDVHKFLELPEPPPPPSIIWFDQ